MTCKGNFIHLLLFKIGTAPTDNCTEPLSDSGNYQGITEDPRDQEIDVIGVSNPSQNPVEGRLKRISHLVYTG